MQSRLTGRSLRLARRSQQQYDDAYYQQYVGSVAAMAPLVNPTVPWSCCSVLSASCHEFALEMLSYLVLKVHDSAQKGGGVDVGAADLVAAKVVD